VKQESEQDAPVTPKQRRENRMMTHFDAVEPLAILAVDAAITGKLAEFPPYIASRGYIHGMFDGYGRTYDYRVIWNQTRSGR